MAHTFHSQQEYDIRCEWGLAGVNSLASVSDVLVIVDVLSFCSAVDIAVGNGAFVYPYKWRDASAATYAQSVGALLVSPNRKQTTGYSLSPASLLGIPGGTRLVLPSPNGATLTASAGQITTFAGCLRNASAVAHACQKAGTIISVIPAGERWNDESLRPAMEDLVGAGAIIHHLAGTRSPEAELAEAAFLYFSDDLQSCLKLCSSGKELVEAGFSLDVELAAVLDASECAPVIDKGAYVPFTSGA